MKKEQLISKLREKGFKVTPQRIAICEFVLSSKDHPTADQVYRVVKRAYPTLSLATVYQTLRLLTQNDMIQELGLTSGISRYDPDTSPHINIICRDCGKIQDYEAKNISRLWSQIIEDLGFKPTGQRLDVYRHCHECQVRMKGSDVL